MTIRPAAVAGLFYPDEPNELADAVARYLRAAGPGKAVPKAIVAPHAGYVYSGAIAASAYAQLAAAKGFIKRVVLLGPAHRVAFDGLAAPRADAFATPLGTLEVDRAAIERISSLPQVLVSDEPHRLEHSLEVHLPFLIATLGAVSLVPLVVGKASAEAVAAVIEALWDGPETLIVVSSDLSHYHDYRTAQRIDAVTSQAIEALDEEAIDYEQACGRAPLAGLLRVARRRGLAAHALDVRNSGDTAGPRDEVVGYGAYVFD